MGESLRSREAANDRAIPSVLSRVTGAVTLAAGGVCLLALMPWLIAAGGDSNPAHYSAWALGTVVLVAYPILLAALLLVGLWLRRHKLLNARVLRRTSFGLFVALIGLVGLVMSVLSR